MDTLELTKTQMRGGVWEGVITNAGNDKPAVAVTFLGKPVADVSLSQSGEGADWMLQVPIPSEAISDGVQTILINDAVSHERLAQVTLIAGEAISDDMRAEVDLLRAELDMLKRAFRRHCVETM